MCSAASRSGSRPSVAQHAARHRADRGEPRPAAQRLRAADRRDERAHRRAGGERDPVGAEHRVARGVVQRLGTRLVERHDVDLDAALAQPVGQHVAALAGAQHERAPRRRAPASASRSPSPTARSGTTSAATPCSRSRSRGARADRRDHRAGERPRVADELEEPVDAVDAREAEEVVARRGRAARRRPAGCAIAGACVTIGAELGERRREPARLRPRARHDDATVPRSGRRSRHASSSRSAGDRADDRDRRRPDPRLLARARRCRRSVPGHDALVGQRAALDDGDGLVRRAALLDRAAARCAAARACPCRRRASPGTPRARASRRSISGLRRVLVAGDERDGAGHAALRHRDAGVRARGDAGRDARARPRPGCPRATAAAPPRRRGRRRTGRRPSAARRTGRRARARAAARSSSSCGTCSPPPILPTSMTTASSRDSPQRLDRDEPVVEHDVGAAQQLERPRGEQPRIARAGADEVDRPGPHATSASARRSTSPPPAASTRSAASAPERLGLGGAGPSSRSRTHAEPSGSPANADSGQPVAVGDGVRADRRVARRVEPAHERALAAQRGPGRGVRDRDRGRRASVVVADARLEAR